MIFDYDTANRVLQTTQDSKAVGYAYDIPNRRRTLTYPGGQVVTEDRDFRERLADIDAGTIASYKYDFGNRVLNRSYGNGTSATYSYNDNNWITHLGHTKFGGELIAGFGYEYDKQGNKRFEQKQHDPRKSEGFAYDNLYRLIHYKVGELDNAGMVSLPLTQTQYDLDKLGNWDKKINDGTTETRVHNGINEITRINGDAIQHDDNGNLSQDSNYNYSYDQENRLTKATFVGAEGIETAGEYHYDALGRRIAKKTGVSRDNQDIRYYYDAARIVEEQSPSGVTKAAYTYGNYVDEVLTFERNTVVNSKRYFVHSNHLYSPEALTSDSGSVVERYSYDAYGKQIVTNASGKTQTKSGVGFERGFTGYVIDNESGLIHARTRSYYPSLGRFNSRMPWFGMGKLKFYAYDLSIIDKSTLVSLASVLENSTGSYLQSRYNLYDLMMVSPSNGIEPYSTFGWARDLWNWLTKDEPKPPFVPPYPGPGGSKWTPTASCSKDPKTGEVKVIVGVKIRF